MDLTNQVVVPPSLPRLLSSLLVACLGIVGGLLLILGPGLILTIVAIGVGGLTVLACIVAVVRRRPRLVITPDGFTIYKLFGEHSQKWEDIRGEFSIVKSGWIKVVGYNLTTEYKARIGRNHKVSVPKCDQSISGAFALSWQNWPSN